ncbi:hypothetical protein VTI74DRAFT_11526 [Chaetomium olivicolor]
MEPPIKSLRMPPDELKKIKEQIAIVTAAITAAEVSTAGGRKILDLWRELKALRRQIEKLEAGKTNQTTNPGLGSGSIEEEQAGSEKVEQAQKVECHPQPRPGQ